MDFAEFDNFLQTHVLASSSDPKWSRSKARGVRGARVLTLEHALQIYIQQQVKAHKNNG